MINKIIMVAGRFGNTLLVFNSTSHESQRKLVRHRAEHEKRNSMSAPAMYYSLIMLNSQVKTDNLFRRDA